MRKINFENRLALIKKSLQIIEKNIDNEEFDCACFARELNMSRTKLFVRIKAATGYTPSALILRLRLKRSKLLLVKHQELSITDIAYKLGFSTLHYFSKCFKECFNTSPAHFRHECQGKKYCAFHVKKSSYL